MRQTKRRFEVLPFYDRSGMERHFAQMAEKGWLIQRLSNYGYTYRRIEPKKLHFAISYYPKASMFDPEPGADQQEFLDFCAHTGWQLACTWAQMQIFYNDREKPIPIETDPVLEVETIHEAMQKNFLPGQLVMAVMGALMLFVQLLVLSGNVVAYLSSPLKLFTLCCWVLVIFMSIADITVYFRWHWRAEAAAEQGEFLPSSSSAVFQKLALAVLGIGMLWLAWSVLASSNSMLKFVMPAMVVCMASITAMGEGIKRLCKRLKFSRNVSRVATFGTIFVMTYAIMGLITFGALSLNERGFFDEEETYVHNGSTWVHYRDELPLTVGDFMVEECDYVCKLDAEQTPLLASQRGYQRPRYDEANWSNIPDLEYEIVTVKLPGLYDACKRELMKQIHGGRSYVPTDPAPWGAEEAYNLVWDDDQAGSRQYLLSYGDTLVEITFGWDVTQDQKAIVGQRLG